MNTCTLDCNSDCKSCLINGNCDTCDNGFYLNTGACPTCDHSVCATCSSDDVTCTLACNSNCGVTGCDVLGDCSDCEDGYYLEDG